MCIIQSTNPSHITYVGLRQGFYHTWAEPFGICDVDRRDHLYIIGKTGTGKTTLTKNMLMQDIARGYGVGLIDPHGDISEELLDAIPPERVNDVVYFHPADTEWPIALNLLRAAPAPAQVASAVVSAFKGMFGKFWGPHLEHVLAYTVASLASVPNTSLLGIQQMLVNPVYRQRILTQVRDPVLLAFWHGEFAAWRSHELKEVISPIENKVGQLFLSPAVRNILSQVGKSRFDVRACMDERRIVIANLSKGTLGEDMVNLLGSLLVSQFYLASMQREDTPEEARGDFYLYVDEFQNFVTTVFAKALSEVRKYRLNVTLANQYSRQVEEEILDAVLGNVGTIIAFRVGHHDALMLEREYASDAKAEHFLNLKRHEVLVRMQHDRTPQVPFVGRTLKTTEVSYGKRADILCESRRRYGRPRAQVEAKIARFLAAKEKSRRNGGNRIGHPSADRSRSLRHARRTGVPSPAVLRTRRRVRHAGV